uniref:Uncharacterized protein n=1 Tax=Timema tahoe TaxID=61484 RepID=A0A7R9FNT4_9NEOP|nr:unnamed protein product [Timema tahoe]
MAASGIGPEVCRVGSDGVACMRTVSYYPFGLNAYILALNLNEIQPPLAPFGPPRVYYAPGTLPRWALHNARDFTPESAKRPTEVSTTWGGALSELV